MTHGPVLTQAQIDAERRGESFAVLRTPDVPEQPDEPAEVTESRASQAQALTNGPPAARTHEQRVQSELQRLRVREAARELYAAEQAGAGELPPLVQLDRFLAEPDDSSTYRIAGLWPTGGRVVLAAPKKAGKTTLTGNLMRSLVDGDDFLDKFKVEPMDRLTLIDNELDARMLRRWLRDHHIGNADRIRLVTLRGRLSSFNILDPAVRTRWAAHLGPGDGVIFDCLRPVLDALGLDESREAGRFLEAFDELTAEAGIPEALINHHHGHGDAERARGDSRIVDWPDANWNLVVENDDSDDRQVYFKARGRDVDEPEQMLTFEPVTRRLSIGGGSRKLRKVETLLDPIGEFLADRDNWGSSQNKIEEAIEGRRDDIRKALILGAERGLWTRVKYGTSWVHSPNTATSPTSPNLAPGEPGDPSSTSPTSPIGARGEGRGDDSPIGTVRGGANPGRCERCGDPLDAPALTNACKANHTNGDRQ